MRKRIILRSFVITLFSTLSFSCLNKTDFSQKDYTWIDVYEENDTLIFQETTSKENDTTIIKKKEVYHAEYQPIARGNLIPHTFKLQYWNKKYADNDNPSSQLIEMYKNTNDIDANPWIKYLGFMYEIDENSTQTSEVVLKLTEKYFNQVLILEKEKNRHFKEYMNVRPNILFWDKKYGIIKYQTFDGKIWERINLK